MGKCRFVLLFLFWGCSESPPLKDGSRLVYSISEHSAGKRKAYTAQIRAQAQREGLELILRTDHGEKSLFVTDRLEPNQEGELLELPLALIPGVAEPGPLWLVPDERRSGKMGVAGIVEGIQAMGQWRVWAVAADTPEGDGERYYEVETGLLVAFRVPIRGGEVTGKLLAVR